MNKAYQRYLEDENYRATILAAARRERTEAVRRLIIEPLRSLLTRPPRRQTRMLRRSAYC